MAEYIQEEEPEEEEKSGGWLTTWADMMSVLLTFFIVLQAFSTISEKKFYEAMSSIQRALTMPLPIRSPGAAHFPAHQTLAEDMEEHISQEGIAGIDVQDFGDRIVLTVESGFLFDLGRAEMTVTGSQVMDGVAKALGEAKGDIRIEGHTCDLPVGRRSDFKNNWWLSTARALTVLEALEKRGLPPQRVSAAGFGEFRPVAPNDSEPNRARNRRVEFIIEKGPNRAD